MKRRTNGMEKWIGTYTLINIGHWGLWSVRELVDLDAAIK